MTRSEEGDGSDDASSDAASSPAPAAVDMLSTGRSRRVNAGNRMKELLEQERDRMEAEGEGGSSAIEPSSSKRVQRVVPAVDDEDVNAIFGDDDGDEDVDFEERGDAEDIVDSDFDQSSDDGSEDEDEGERVLQDEERAAKKASRARARNVTLAGGTKKAVVRPAPRSAEHDAEPGKAKRISFAADANVAEGPRRSSKRAATMEMSQTIQTRLKEEEEKRAKQIELAKPKHKKVRLTQADYVTEALEMEEANRESLGTYLRREEERRERERRREKKKMEGPFLRWRSVMIDRTATETRPLIHEVTTDKGTASSEAVTADPVFAAREAASKERNALHQKNLDFGIDAAPEGINQTSEARMQEVHEVTQIDASQNSNVKTDNASQSSNIVVLLERHPEDDVSDSQFDASCAAPPPREARAYVSLHDVPSSLAWPKVFSHLLGSHVDWSKHFIVPARNRPLRPRQSVCAITGLPARYRDPRSGVPYATREAYHMLTRVMHGDFRWSGIGADMSNSDKNVFDMGCYLDAVEEPGANDVYLVASMQASKTDAKHVKDGSKNAVASMYRPRGALAPGDEQAVVAAAQALPAGTTRSGSRRSGVH